MKYLIEKIIRAILISLTIGSITTMGFSVNVLGAAGEDIRRTIPRQVDKKSMVICCKNNNTYPMRLVISYFNTVGNHKYQGWWLLSPQKKTDLIVRGQYVTSNRQNLNFKYFADRVEPTWTSTPGKLSTEVRGFKQALEKWRNSQFSNFSIIPDNGEDKLYFEID